MKAELHRRRRPRPSPRKSSQMEPGAKRHEAGNGSLRNVVVATISVLPGTFTRPSLIKGRD